MKCTFKCLSALALLLSKVSFTVAMDNFSDDQLAVLLQQATAQYDAQKVDQNAVITMPSFAVLKELVAPGEVVKSRDQYTAYGLEEQVDALISEVADTEISFGDADGFVDTVFGVYNKVLDGGTNDQQVDQMFAMMLNSQKSSAKEKLREMRKATK